MLVLFENTDIDPHSHSRGKWPLKRREKELNQSINHLFVSDQWSISKKKKEIDNKRRNKSNKSSTQYSLENSIAKHKNACGRTHMKT